MILFQDRSVDKNSENSSTKTQFLPIIPSGTLMAYPVYNSKSNSIFCPTKPYVIKQSNSSETKFPVQLLSNLASSKSVHSEEKFSGEFSSKSLSISISSSSMSSSDSGNGSLSRSDKKKRESIRKISCSSVGSDGSSGSSTLMGPPQSPPFKPTYFSPTHGHSQVEFSSSEQRKNDLRCQRCQIEFPCFNSLLEHCKSLHPDALLFCNQCFRSCSVDEMAVHLNRCRGEFSCQDCLSSFSSIGLLKKHCIRVHQCGESVRCEVCSKILSNKASLQLHMRQHLPETESGEHKCCFCHKSFHQRVHLQIHQERHHGNIELAAIDRTFTCDRCDSKFIYESVLRHHQALHRKKDLSKIHRCDHCHALFGDETDLNRHFNESGHHNGAVMCASRSYQCPSCQRGFKRQYEAIDHLLTAHLDSSQGTCPCCGKTYSSQCNMRRHWQRKHCDKQSQVSSSSTNCVYSEQNEIQIMGLDEAITDVFLNGILPSLSPNLLTLLDSDGSYEDDNLLSPMIQ